MFLLWINNQALIDLKITIKRIIFCCHVGNYILFCSSLFLDFPQPVHAQFILFVVIVHFLPLFDRIF